jgi:hypothetical protein
MCCAKHLILWKFGSVALKDLNFRNIPSKNLDSLQYHQNFEGCLVINYKVVDLFDNYNFDIKFVFIQLAKVINFTVVYLFLKTHQTASCL